ncbi:cytochrome P450 alkane hydroxylase-like protein [Hyaloscypha variabilis F]|uniref:Cytochrome P450 alkane hydroxylase-like protein n=1 Tax=Hyaloscypha variabilis (strain UAMH 11265 / GT02V1 / F) TaxID=1149755 RepID=A0A2J6RIQ5_HYAVF|nr:cytochrome P450 alkane hydroxylase-like protein [Hyaloscypha variabilis F]
MFKDGVLAILASAIFIYFLYYTFKELSYRLASRKAGCSSPIRYWHWDPILGFDLLLRKIKDMNKGDSEATDREILKAYGKTTILATQVDRFDNEPMNHKPCQPFLGDGIITRDGAFWKRSRQLTNPIFSRAQVSTLAPFEVHVGRMIRRIPRDGSTVDLQPLLKMLFLDSSTEFIFGKSANSLSSETNSPVARRLPVLFNQALEGMFPRLMLGRFAFLLKGSEKQCKKTCAEVHAIIDGYIDEEMELQAKLKTQGKELDTDGDSAYGYVLLRELVKQTDDKEYIRSELANIFFPARDTAAMLTRNVIFMVARRPEVWDKLRAEVLAIGDAELTFELLKTLKYTHAVMNETLRLNTPVGGSWKTCVSPCILPHGGGSTGRDPILLQSGDQVRISFVELHTDPEIWGDDARVFRPERWDGLKQSWNHIPFMGGRRIYMLLREFKALENRDECFEYVDKIVFTRESRHGVKVAFVPES